MALFESNIALYFAFAISATIENYFFMMQRSALEISRSSGIEPREGRKMLPLWYGLVWLAKLGKWAAFVYIGMRVSWLLAGLLLAVTFAFQIFVPIPHRQFIPVFRRKLAKEIGEAINQGSGIDAGANARLYKQLFEASKDSRFE